MPWLVIVLFLSATFNNLSEGSHQKKLPSAVVVGTVYCDTCFQKDLAKNSHFISGATIAVECKDENSRSSFRKEVKTDEHGEFKDHLPFQVSKHVKKIKRCFVKLVSSSEPYCAVSSRATSSLLHLTSRKEGEHIFSAGFFSFKPENQPDICSQKPRIQNSNQFDAEKTTLPSISPGPDSNPAFPHSFLDPPTPDFPPVNHYRLPPLPILPRLPPLPQLPPLPSLPGLPNLPPLPGKIPKSKTIESPKTTQSSYQKELDLGDFSSTPPLFPPNPLEPLPILPQPPPSPLIPFPSIPGLTPPDFSLPFPPPSPVFPEIPPDSFSSSSQKRSP